MQKNLKELVVVLKRKGILETLIHGSKLILNKLISVIRISLLRLRSYNIDYSVLLRGRTTFFQSTKNAINISAGVVLGNGTRITGGGKGKIFIKKNVLIDDFTFIMAHERIEIGENTTIASFCFITDFNHKYHDEHISVLEQGYETNSVKIGKNVWIGTHCIILPGVSIGDGSVVGAGSVVTKDMPRNSISVGNPAKVIKKIR